MNQPIAESRSEFSLWGGSWTSGHISLMAGVGRIRSDWLYLYGREFQFSIIPTGSYWVEAHSFSLISINFQI